MAFVKDHQQKLKYTYRCDFTFQMAISEHLKPKFLLRSMPQEPLDNASNSFAPKLETLDRNLSSQNMRGQTAHNRRYSSNLLGEKKTSILGVFQLCTFKNQVSGIPWPICCPVICICDVLPGWGLNISIASSLDELLSCLLRKVVVVIAWLEVRSLAGLLIESYILAQIYSVISPSWCMDRIFIGFP